MKEITTEKPRIDWIDLAKGFCILLVMWWHIKELYSNRGFTDRNEMLYMATYFRMPLYFFLSGLFFKTYSGYFDFLRRKTNKLLVPFVFFGLIGIVYSLVWADKLPAQRTWQNLYPFVPVWFLWCLLLMNNLFYLVRHLCRRRKPLIYLCVVCLGVIGYNAGGNYIHVLHVRSALTAMPFFVAGYAVRNHTNFLTRRVRKYEWVFIAIAIFLLYGLVMFNGKVAILYVNNVYSVPVWALYLGGAAGIYAILTLAKLLHRLPVISYLGRYSIIVLITHYPIVYLFPKSWNRMLFHGFHGYCALEELVLLACVQVPIICLCKRYLPWLFAQEDLVKTWDISIHKKKQPISNEEPI